PHLGASTFEANYNAARRAASQLIDFDDKGIASYIVNRDVPEGLDPAYGDLAFTLTRLCRAVLGREASLSGVETSIYGTLKPYAQWLLVPIVASLSDEFDRSGGQAGAARYLRDCGIEYSDRETDEHKRYHNSLTVDLIASLDSGTLRRVSVRGTIAEGRMMVSRINDFDKLYFEPHGPTVLFVYPDRPGILGQIGAALARAEINIDDVRNPHDSQGRQSIAILQVNRLPTSEKLKEIGAAIGATVAAAIQL
ncbi:MAG: ACT domain-containing protein, partial [Kiritimatiellia bacterium]|nr:ACT domain-containing protein [Kiritimatiellia bacterium]